MPEEQAAAPPDEMAIETADTEGMANEPPAEEPALPIDNRQWYIIHTYSGFERKVAESLKTRAEAFGFAEQIGQILGCETGTVKVRVLRAMKEIGKIFMDLRKEKAS